MSDALKTWGAIYTDTDGKQRTVQTDARTFEEAKAKLLKFRRPHEAMADPIEATES